MRAAMPASPKACIGSRRIVASVLNYTIGGHARPKNRYVTPTARKVAVVACNHSWWDKRHTATSDVFLVLRKSLAEN